MSTPTARRLAVEKHLRMRSADHDHSMEEARALTAASAAAHRPSDLAEVATRLFGPEGGVEFELPERRIGREPPRFD